MHLGHRGWRYRHRHRTEQSQIHRLLMPVLSLLQSTPDESEVESGSQSEGESEQECWDDTWNGESQNFDHPMIKAAAKGDVEVVQTLLRKDPALLHCICDMRCRSALVGPSSGR